MHPIIWLILVVVYLFLGGVTYLFVYPSFDTYNNLKSLLMGLLWPLSWVVMTVGGFVRWLLVKQNMSSYHIVTVKLPKNPAHDPTNKVKGECPAFGGYCTDVTGAHHSTIVRDGLSARAIRIEFQLKGFHVTRIERMPVTF